MRTCYTFISPLGMGVLGCSGLRAGALVMQFSCMAIAPLTQTWGRHAQVSAASTLWDVSAAHRWTIGVRYLPILAQVACGGLLR